MQAELTQTADIDHFMYPRAESAADADACAWVFKNAQEFVPYFCKFPELGDGEVRARVLHTGLCLSDVLTGRESWGPANFPLCAGHEVVGQIERVGAGVKDFKAGDIVAFGPIRDACLACEHCHAGDDNLCDKIDDTEKWLYGLHFGGYCTHIQQPASYCFHVPAGMDLANIPPVLCAGVTVFAPMQRHIKKQGARIGVMGIGGLGHLAVQYGKAMGCHVTGFTTSAAKVDYIKSLGATQVIVVDKDFASLKDHQHEFDFLINTLPVSNFATFEAYLATLKSGGALIQVGIPNINEHMEFSVGSIVHRQLSIHGSIVSSIKETKETLEFTHKHGVRVEVENFSFEDFPKALDRLENGRPQFRCVVNVKDFVDKHFPAK